MPDKIILLDPGKPTMKVFLSTVHKYDWNLYWKFNCNSWPASTDVSFKLDPQNILLFIFTLILKKFRLQSSSNYWPSNFKLFPNIYYICFTMFAPYQDDKNPWNNLLKAYFIKYVRYYTRSHWSMGVSVLTRVW